MNKLYGPIVFLSLLMLFIPACNSRQLKIVVNNITRDSFIVVRVSLNGQEFADSVQKEVSSFSGVTFLAKRPLGDSCQIDVVVSNLNLRKTEIVGLRDIENIIITVRSVPASFHPLINGELQTIPVNNEILIGCFGKKPKTKAI